MSKFEQNYFPKLTLFKVKALACKKLWRFGGVLYSMDFGSTFDLFRTHKTPYKPKSGLKWGFICVQKAHNHNCMFYDL